jgi:hypothetical protein
MGDDEHRSTEQAEALSRESLEQMKRDIDRLKRVELAARLFTQDLDARDVPSDRRDLLALLQLALTEDRGS